MKKTKTLFIRLFNDKHEVTIINEVAQGCEWVLNGEGVATRKLDGICTSIINNELYKRYDAKGGKPIPARAIKCQDKADPVTGHLPCWVKVDFNNKEDKWITKDYLDQKNDGFVFEDGTYELCGPHFNGNPRG